MADTETKDAAPTTPAAMVEKIAGILQKWPGADSESPKKDPEAEVPPEAHDMATRARKKYDGTLRWVLGAFSAIGMLIFGSLPFTELRNVEPVLVFAGLLSAAIGLAIIIWAAARGLELQDASLGELAYTFAFKTDRNGIEWPWVRSPRRKANAQLKKILQGSSESSAHLGPGVTSVEALIGRLGDVEAKAMEAYVKWDGKAPSKTEQDPDLNELTDSVAAKTALPAAAKTKQDPDLNELTDSVAAKTALPAAAKTKQVPDLNELTDSVAAKTALAAAAKNELETAQTVLAELREQTPESDQDKSKHKNALQETEQRYLKVLELLPDPEYLKEAATSAAWDQIRDLYRAHRALVLDESLVAQMRGTFSVVLRWLFLGAALVAVGGITYAYAVANPTSEGSVKNPVNVTLNAESAALKEIVDDKCVSGAKTDTAATLEALLVTSRDSDGLQDGPFSFTPLDGKCAGKTFAVEEGGGHYVGIASSEATPSAGAGTTTEEAEVAWEPVTITVFPFTSAWEDLEECRGPDSQLSDTAALLSVSDDADAEQDGPFTARITEGPCAGYLVNVEEGRGRYQAQP